MYSGKAVEELIVIDSLIAVMGEFKVYTFTVADYHTYYVGQDKILVHNCGGKKGSKNLVQEVKDLQAKKAASTVRTQKRKAQSNRGQTGGRSNQDVRGSHHTQSKGKGAGGDRHSKRTKRSAREQKNATQSKKNGQG